MSLSFPVLISTIPLWQIKYQYRRDDNHRLTRLAFSDGGISSNFPVHSFDAPMQNWRDNAQARMPGFRERVIHIKLASGEGGLKLAMDEQKVSRLIARGEYAGGRLIDVFSGSEDGPLEQRPHWNDHRYARFRILMSSLERLFQGFQSAYTARPML